ncbi:MAG TPA: polymer-forming cytoskeletal protein [bacterium]|nr:polymer-forming cytoskeletal protein [bacterium]
MGTGSKTELNAYLAKGTNFKGELRFSGIVRLDGIFDGTIISDGTLVVGDTGVLKGEINVGELLSSGIVEGTIKATKAIDVSGQGKLLGEVFTPSLNVAPGVLVEAQLRVGTGSGTSSSKGSVVGSSRPKDDR